MITIKSFKFKDSAQENQNENYNQDQNSFQREENYIKRLTQQNPSYSHLPSFNHLPSFSNLIQRKSMPKFLFAIIILIMMIFSFQNFLLFFTSSANSKIIYTTTTLIVFIVLMFGISLYFSNLKQIAALYLLLDPIALSLITSIIGIFGLTNSIAKISPTFATIIRILVPITLFTLSGTIRVIIKWANFKRWQNIIFKISLLISGLCYFMVGFYIMYINYLPSKGMLPVIDASFKDFSLLYTFGSISLYKQFVNLHNSFDRTDKLKYVYKLINEIQQEELLEPEQVKQVK